MTGLSSKASSASVIWGVPHWESFYNVPSKVLFMRGVPKRIMDDELMATLSRYGAVVTVVQNKVKSIAFAEFEKLEEAVACHDLFKKDPLRLGKTQDVVDVAYSNKECITEFDMNPHSKILLIHISNVAHPVNVSVMMQLCSQYGTVIKIVVFEQGDSIQSLIQMSGPHEARNVKTYLDGQYIYTGGNLMHVSYSDVKEVIIKQNSPQSWDCSLVDSIEHPPMIGVGVDVPTICVCSHLSEATKALHLAALFACYGNVMKVKTRYSNRNNAIVLMQSRAHCMLAIQHLNGLSLHGKIMMVEMARGNLSMSSYLHDDDVCVDLEGVREYNRHKKVTKLHSPMRILHICNLPSKITDQELIRHIFMVSGKRVLSLRFLEENHQMCMASFEDLPSAVVALCEAHNSVLGGRHLKVGFGHATAFHLHLHNRDTLKMH